MGARVGVKPGGAIFFPGGPPAQRQPGQEESGGPPGDAFQKGGV